MLECEIWISSCLSVWNFTEFPCRAGKSWFYEYCGTQFFSSDLLLNWSGFPQLFFLALHVQMARKSDYCKQEAEEGGTVPSILMWWSWCVKQMFTMYYCNQSLLSIFWEQNHLTNLVIYAVLWKFPSCWNLCSLYSTYILNTENITL